MGKRLIFPLLVVFIVLGGSFWVYRNRNLQELKTAKIKTGEESYFSPTVSPPLDPSSSSPSSPSAIAGESELISVDGTWNKYVNYKLGFSIKIPKKMSLFGGSCKWNEENGDHSYRPEPELVPVKVFEEGNMVYIVNGSYAELGGETKEESAGGTRSYFSECNEVINSLAKVKDKENYYERGWQIIVEEAKNDEDLDRFIKNYFGSDCRLGDRIHDYQAGVYKISIDQGVKNYEEGEAPEETGCFVNYAYAIKYFPEKNKVASWNLGQDFTFYEDVEHPYDAEMAESFEFLK